MTVKEIYTNMRIEATKGFAYYVGFISKRKYTELCKKVEFFKKVADEDFDLGVLNFAEYQKDLAKYELLKKSLETAEQN